MTVTSLNFSKKEELGHPPSSASIVIFKICCHIQKYKIHNQTLSVLSLTDQIENVADIPHPLFIISCYLIMKRSIA